ncbi:EscU/YscU/HrcU family type III secretion system export apparatus switch protein [Stomatohabitans albus]
MDQIAMLAYLGEMATIAITIAAPIVLLLGIINVAAQFAQVRWTPKKLKFDWKKLNPVGGIKNMFKPTRLGWETIKNILKIAAVTYVCYSPAVELIHTLIHIGVGTGAKGSALLIGQAALHLLQTMVVVGICIAGVDYLVSRKQIRDQIKMSKQEIKEEYKQQEGDPHVKGQRRARQMAMSRNRMMAAAADATAVIANPTHFSVAIAYDPLVGAPRVVAKGQGELALRIREVALDNEVPIIHDIPLARTLYRVVEIDEQIPEELYEAMAQVLAWVWSMRAKGTDTSWMESPYAEDHEDLLRYKRKRVPQKRGAAPQAHVELSDNP